MKMQEGEVNFLSFYKWETKSIILIQQLLTTKPFQWTFLKFYLLLHFQKPKNRASV